MLRSPMRILFLLAIFILGPNLLWASRSSVMLRNETGETLTVRLILDDDPPQQLDPVTVDPGEGRFLWIAPAGEASLSIEVQDGLGWRRHCSEYVEAGMYRVEAVINAPDAVECATSLPILERLLVIDVLG